MITKLSDLRAALAVVGPLATKQRATPPILNHLLVFARSGDLNIMASDLDSFQEEIVPCEGDLEPCCVSAEKLVGWVNLCSAETVELIIENHKLRGICGGKILLPTLDADEFPPAPKDLKPTACPSGDVAEGIQKVSWCASMDEARYVLNTVHLKLTPQTLIVESSDGKLWCEFRRSAICAKADCLVSTNQSKRLSDSLARAGATLLVSDKWAGCQHNSGFFYCKQVEGDFPDVGAMMKQNAYAPKPLGTFSCPDWIREMEIVAMLGKYSLLLPAPLVTFSEKGALLEYVHMGQDYRTTLPGEFAQKLEVTLPAIRFGRALKCFNGTCRVEAVDNISPVRLTDSETSVLVMPMR